MVGFWRETDLDSVGEVAKRHGISQPIIYAWRKKFAHVNTGEVKRLKRPE